MEQFEAVIEMFGTNPGTPEFHTVYPALLAKGLDGTYYDVGVLGSADPSDETVARSCERNRTEIDATDPLRLIMTAHAGRPTSYDVTFTSIGGNVYGVAADKDKLINYLAAPGATLPETVVLNLLRSWNGIATILRPQPDIVYIQINYQTGRLLARCPTPAP